MDTVARLEIRSMALEFAASEIRPHAPAWSADRAFPPDLFRRLAELGFLGMGIPEALGGAGLDGATRMAVLEALAWGDAAIGTILAEHDAMAAAILRAGTPEQRERWLPGLARGEPIGVLAAEVRGQSPGSTDGLTVRPVAEGGWLLRGTTAGVLSPDAECMIFLSASVEGAQRGEGGREAEEAQGANGGSSRSPEAAPRALLVPADASGTAWDRAHLPLGLSAAGMAAVRFDDTHVPDDARLEGAAADSAVEEALDAARAGLAAVAVGVAQAAYEHAARYATERRQFGRPIGEFEGIAEKLAGMAVGIATARSLSLAVGAMFDGGNVPLALAGLPAGKRAAAAMAKLAAQEVAEKATDEAVQVFGGYGYMRDYPVERLMRDAKGLGIRQGSDEVLRRLVSTGTGTEEIRHANGSGEE